MERARASGFARAERMAFGRWRAVCPECDASGGEPIPYELYEYKGGASEAADAHNKRCHEESKRV